MDILTAAEYAEYLATIEQEADPEASPPLFAAYQPVWDEFGPIPYGDA